MLCINSLFLALFAMDLMLAPPLLLIFSTLASRRPLTKRRRYLIYTGATSWTLLSAAGIITLVQS